MAGKEYIDKSLFDNSWYKPGPIWKRTLWYFTNIIFFLNPMFPFTSVKPFLLRLYGAKVGKRCLIKPNVNIKYPWFLTIGDYVSIGEGVWIDNLAQVTLEDQVTISQGALLLTGNHNYKAKSFDLMIGEIHISRGAWICARSIVGPGIEVGEYAVVGLGAVANENCEAFGIYLGNPATRVNTRRFEESEE